MLKAINIKWDTDGDKEVLARLPKEMIIPDYLEREYDPNDPYAEEISDWLSDEIGFCHEGFEIITIYVEKEFPKLEECDKATELCLASIGRAGKLVELMIESNEPDNELEPEYQEPTYIVYITINGETIDRLVHPYDFENMDAREIIHILTDIFLRIGESKDLESVKSV